MKYLWNDVKIILGGKEIEFTPINNYMSVFESDIEISFEELIKNASKEFCVNEKFEIEKNLPSTLRIGNKYRTINFNGIELKENDYLEIDNNQYIIVAILADRIILKLTATKIK